MNPSVASFEVAKVPKTDATINKQSLLSHRSICPALTFAKLDFDLSFDDLDL